MFRISQEVFAIEYQAHQMLWKNPILITDSDNDYILDCIFLQEKFRTKENLTLKTLMISV